VASNTNVRLIKYILDCNYVKDCPVRQKLKKPGGFPPPERPPGKPTYDQYGFYSDNYNTKLVAYRARYKEWETYCKPFEEVFGVPFKIIREKPIKKYYPPVKIEPVEHPLDDII
tara:strand:+ start:61 stop:402 length:342 start_codon:yes stop_codon:yes gene_type:complete